MKPRRMIKASRCILNIKNNRTNMRYLITQKIMKFRLILPFTFLIGNCTNTNNDSSKETKSTSNNIEGTYVSLTDPRTKLTLKENNEFEYIRINSRNKIDEWFFRTKGTWKLDSKNLILNSTKDSVSAETVNVKKEQAKDSNMSKFHFFDVYNDTVGYW